MPLDKEMAVKGKLFKLKRKLVDAFVREEDKNDKIYYATSEGIIKIFENT